MRLALCFGFLWCFVSLVSGFSGDCLFEKIASFGVSDDNNHRAVGCSLDAFTGNRQFKKIRVL